MINSLFKSSLIILLCAISIQVLSANISFKEVPNDPLKTRIYVLENGLTVYLSQHKTKPVIHSFIAVKAGSSYDPADNTGLAHYLEHMLFKGSPHFGTNNWEKEKIYLAQISALYEQHKKEMDLMRKKEIYHQIDSVSNIASNYAIPNEFDKMMSSIGAKGVNAFTSFDQTVYTEEIPGNQIEKWAKIESERMNNLVLRIFHTELEAVYEEFNIGQDDDGNQANDEMLLGLFPNHPYGTQTTIGLGTHLKNPSMIAIEKYFKKYYVPNNMAICLSGDLDYDSTIQIINQYFGKWKKDATLKDNISIPLSINKSMVKEVFGPKEESVMVGFMAPRLNVFETNLLKVMDAILANQKAGLMDLNLVQQQKVLNAVSQYMVLKDASVMVLQGNPREGQSLEQVRELLMGEVEKIKKGQFEESNISAAIKFLKLRKMKDFENNDPRAFEYVDLFTRNQHYDSSIIMWNQLGKITKKDIVDFANKFFTYNVTIYKKTGTPQNIMKVEKPAITPIQTNRNMESDFVKNIVQMKESKFKPSFIDYKKDILETNLSNGIKLNYVKNENNPTFNLFYILDMGTIHDKKLEFALKYLPYLGTAKMSAEQLQIAFFKLGVSMDVFSSEDKMYISLSGLEESLNEALILFEDVLKNCKADEVALANMKEGILKERADEKLNKQIIFWQKLRVYAQYGALNPQNFVLSNQEVKSLTSKELVDKLQSFINFQHRIFYYGQQNVELIKNLLNKNHIVNQTLQGYPTPQLFTQMPIEQDRVLFVEYDMVQAEIGMLSRDIMYDKSIVPASRLFNEYFGGGMGSVVFQEIRESKALAYSAFSSYSLAKEKDKYNFMFAYIGTQADKMKNAIESMRGLLNELPYSEKLFNLSRDGMIKSIEADRIKGLDVFWNYEAANKLGQQEDIRKSIYASALNAKFENLADFYAKHVKNKKFVFSILGSKKSLNMELLKSYGNFKELSLEELFGY